MTFNEVASTSSTSIVLTGLTTGSTSTFYVIPVNVNGIGNKSQEVTITIADKPAQMSPVVITLDGTNAKLSWTEPNNYGSSIINYTVYI